MTGGDGRGAKLGATAAVPYVLCCLGPGYNKGQGLLSGTPAALGPGEA